jgi:hypothetical protein
MAPICILLYTEELLLYIIFAQVNLWLAEVELEEGAKLLMSKIQH